MRRIVFAVLVVVSLVATAVFLAIATNPTTAQQGQQPPPNKNAAGPSAALPLTRVVMFTSGVAYFQREGEVEGNTRIDLTFPARDVNDLLKSLVVQDLKGGQVSIVNYDSYDPVERALKSFALDLSKEPTFGQLLRQARGENVEVDFQGQVLKGSIVGVEKQRQPVGKDQIVEVEFLNLLTSDGLRNLPLAQVQRLRLVNPLLDRDLRAALDVLAQQHDTHRRAVSLHFVGEGKRPVRVGYVAESPIWKTSYRLVLDEQGAPLLQGWAIVDNATEEDWRQVEVLLVSGRPISFIMNLYQPLYVPRPVVEPELFKSLRPPTHAGALDVLRQDRVADQARRLEERAGFAAKAPAVPGAAGALDPRQGVAPDVQTLEVGDFFQYFVKQPVSLARQRSAMLPIVNQPVECTRVSIYNTAVHAKHPLLGLKFKNATDLHLMQGPVTVFEGASYAGDARLPDLQPKEERLLSYAVDQGTEVEPKAKSEPERLLTVKIVKGILYANYKLREVKTYSIKNRSGHERLMLLEHPVRADWALVNPEKPSERSRDVYRFAVTVPPGKSASQEVVEEQGRVSQVILSTSDDQTIRLYLTSSVTSSKVKAALEQAVALKIKVSETQRELAGMERQSRSIVEDQVRIRANMERLPPNSAPYQRYLKKLDEQETQIESLQEQMRKLRAREEEQRRTFEAYLLGLNVE